MRDVRKLLLTLLMIPLLGSFVCQAQNLVLNGGFENDLANWWTQAAEGTNASFGVVSDDKVEGEKALRVEVITPGASAWNVQMVNNINNGWPSVAGKTYTMTFWAKAAAAGSSFKAIQQLGGAYLEKTFSLTSSWQQYEWTFDAGANDLELKFHFPTAGTFYIDDIMIPPSSAGEDPEMVELVLNGDFESGSGNNFENWWAGSGDGAASFTAETSDVKAGSRAFKAEVTALGTNPWDVQAVNDAWASKAGESYTLTFWAKAETSGASLKAVQQIGNSYSENNYTLTTTWEQYQWNFTAQADDLQLKFYFRSTGTFYIDEVSIPTEVDTTPPPPPYTPTGDPIAAGKTKFLGNVYSTSQIPYFENYWNQVTPENAGKWGDVEASRDVMNWTQLDAAYNFAKANDFPFRFHVLIWGNQQPAWIEALPAAEQLEEIKEWFAAVAERYPDIDYLEVVNEPLHDAPRGAGNGNYIEALGGDGATGWDWVLESFRMARQYFPNTPLVLNDYSVTNSQRNAENYIRIISLLQAENLLDVVGIQAHAFETTVPASVTATNLDRIAAQGLPIMVTEMDIDGRNDQTQLNSYQEIFPIFWDHPSVIGVTLWGWKPGMWRTDQGAYLALQNGHERPALQWLRAYVENNAPVITPDQSFAIDGGQCNVLGHVLATDADANTSLHNWQITGGDGAGLFMINAATGELSIVDAQKIDFSRTGYQLEISVSDEHTSSAATVVTVAIPDKVYVSHKGKPIHINKLSAPDHLEHGDCLGKGEQPIVAALAASSGLTVGGKELLVYPNPVREKLTVALGANETNVTAVQILELATGRILVHKPVHGRATVELERGVLRSGVYLLRTQGDQQMVRKIILE